MLLTEEVEINLTNQVKYYEKLGYDIPRVKDKKGRMRTPQGTKIIVKVDDLPKGSHAEVEVLCDYCLEEGMEIVSTRKWQDYINSKKNSPISKDCCGNPNCVNKKREETMLFRYGKKSSMQIEEFKLKQFNTNIERYGFKNPLQREDIKIKIKQTRIEKYGVEHMLQLQECKEKMIKTSQQRYGVDWYTQTDEYKIKSVETFRNNYNVDNPSQSEEIKQKTKETCQLKYGVDHPMQNQKIKDKMWNTLYRNGTQKTSKQQLYIHNIIGGELNYLISRMFLDIAYVNEKIYVEYDGGFHNGKVICGQMTQEEFDKKEQKRSHQLSDWEWKEIRIISISDKLPLDTKIIEMIRFAKEYIYSGHSWIKFDIDKSKITNSLGEFDYDFGELRYIKEKDLEEVC